MKELKQLLFNKKKKTGKNEKEVKGNNSSPSYDNANNIKQNSDQTLNLDQTESELCYEVIKNLQTKFKNILKLDMPFILVTTNYQWAQMIWECKVDSQANFTNITLNNQILELYKYYITNSDSILNYDIAKELIDKQSELIMESEKILEFNTNIIQRFDKASIYYLGIYIINLSTIFDSFDLSPSSRLLLNFRPLGTTYIIAEVSQNAYLITFSDHIMDPQILDRTIILPLFLKNNFIEQVKKFDINLLLEINDISLKLMSS